MSVAKGVGYQRIATEEAWSPPEMLQMYRDALARRSIADIGFNSMWGFYLGSTSARATQIIEKLQWLDERRIRDMDASGIDKQLLLLTSPGVQVFDAATGSAVARSSNDQLADAIRKYPARFAGLAAVAPQDPRGAAAEIERAMTRLKLNGVVVNSHVHGEYLDKEKFWDVFAAAEACNAPIYIHPNTAPDNMIAQFLEAGLDGAIYGFAVETGLHVLRLIVAGVFDRFPKLKIVIGHVGEALPFWLYRLDYMYRATLNSQRYPNWKPNRRLPSEYLKENVYLTTSGVAWAPVIQFAQQVLGMDRVLYAMDYPFQFVVEEVVAADAIPLSPADKRAFFQGNAERVFSL